MDCPVITEFSEIIQELEKDDKPVTVWLSVGHQLGAGIWVVAADKSNIIDSLKNAREKYQSYFRLTVGEDGIVLSADRESEKW